MQVPEFTVVDFNAGFGGRSLAFRDCGFSVVTAAESDPVKQEILRGIVPNIPIFTEPISLENLSSLPGTDILMADIPAESPARLRVNQKKDDVDSYLHLFSEFILCNQPKAFLIQIPAVLVQGKSVSFLSAAARRRYVITYRVCRESEYSGFPVNGRQAYFVGIRNDIGPERFCFPKPIYESPYRIPFREAPEDVEPWYRNVPRRFGTHSLERLFPFYNRNFKGEVVGGEQVSVRPYECYLVDEIGMRRITHNEYAYLKGYPNYPFNNCKNRFKAYRMLQSAPDIYIVRAIAASLRNYLEHNTETPHFEDWPAYRVPLEEDVSDKRGDALTEQRISTDRIIKPRNKIRRLQIEKLKGLKKLDILFEKNLTAIMGVNGVGKSTVLHALACMFSPDEKGEDHKWKFFFTPTPDASWQGSQMVLTYFDENTQTENQRKYRKSTDRWSPRYTSRPKRDVFHLGIDSGLPEIEKERQTSYIDYHTSVSEDRLAERIVHTAAQILCKDYQSLTDHAVKNKHFFGVRTLSDINYSALSMGAGEQRLIKILTVVYHAAPYSLILIDEIDLLLHSNAQKQLIKQLSDLAQRKNLQIIFTTHSLEIGKLTEFVDIRYLYHTREKTLVYDRITPDIIFDMNRESTQPLTVYVEDDLAEAIVSQLSDGLRISRYVNIRNIGSAQNAFTLAAGMMIEGNSLEHRLIVLDGDVYRTDEDKKRQLRRLLSGTETNHDDKIDAALSLITQFSLPEGNCPEKFIYDLLLDVDGADEATDCAKQVTGVVDSHDWLNQIVERMNQDRKIVLLKIIEQAAESDKWSTYVERVRRWLIEQAKVLNLYSP